MTKENIKEVKEAIKKVAEKKSYKVGDQVKAYGKDCKIVDGNWMKTLGVLSPPGGACSSGVAKITPAFAATPEILAQAWAG
jgi:hypothetical protein